MPDQSIPEASDRSLNPTDAKTDKNYFSDPVPSDAAELDAMVGEGEVPLSEGPHFSTDDALPPELEVESIPRSKSTKGTRMKAKTTKSGREDATGSRSKSGDASAKGKASSEIGALRQKAIDLVHKSSEEIAHRYAHAYDEMKDISKKVDERLKGRPFQIAMGAAGVVGVGVVLAKKYTQNRSSKSAKPSSSKAKTHS